MKRRLGDDVAYATTLVFGAVVLSITALLAYELFHNSAAARHRFGLAFLTTTTWDPVAERFGALAFMYGTVITSLIALASAVPAGIAAAIFLAELPPPRVSEVAALLVGL